MAKILQVSDKLIHKSAKQVVGNNTNLSEWLTLTDGSGTAVLILSLNHVVYKRNINNI